MCAQGLVLVGPVLHQWYNFMARIVPSTTTAGALQRLFLDQVVFAPIFISGFFTALMTIEVRVPEFCQDFAASSAAAAPALQFCDQAWRVAIVRVFQGLPVCFKSYSQQQDMCCSLMSASPSDTLSATGVD